MKNFAFHGNSGNNGKLIAAKHSRILARESSALKLLLTNATVALLFPLALFSQIPSSKPQNLPPGAIDGSKTPDLIPDTVALRLVLSSFRISGTASDQETTNAVKKQEIRLKRINLSEVDKSVFRTVIADFADALGTWESRTTEAIKNGQVFVISPDIDRDAIVMRTRDSLKQRLTSEGWEHFARYVTGAKRTMIVWP